MNNAVGKPINNDKTAVAVAINIEVKITFTNVGFVALTKFSRVNGVVTPPNLPVVKTDIKSIEITGNAAKIVKKIKPGKDQNQPSWRELLLPPLLFNIFTFY